MILQFLIAHRLPILTWLQIFLLASALVYVVWQNLFFSEDWWLLPLRDIDDMAMNSATEDMRQAVEGRVWGRVASFFQYAYGAGFYLWMMLLTTPADLLNSPQAQIIIGRNASLVAIFLTSLVVALIGRRVFPEHQRLWLVVLGLGLITPISLINSTKMHVNGWSALFGVVAIYFLIYQSRLSRNFLFLGCLSMGAAIGFKLTALTVVPIFLALVVSRLPRNWLPGLASSILGITASATLVGAPILFAFPVHPEGASQIVDPLLKFAAMGGEYEGSNVSTLWNALSFSGHPLMYLCLLGFAFVLGARAWRTSQGSHAVVLPLSIAGTIVVTFVLLSILVSKPPIYLATYALNVSVLLPIGVLALGNIRVGRVLQLASGWSLVCLNLLLSPQFVSTVMTEQNYASKASSADIQRKLHVASELSPLVSIDSTGIRVLLDSSSVFPVSHIKSGVGISMMYGDFSARLDSPPVQGGFTYIVFDTYSYYGKPQEQEELARETFRANPSLGGSRYELIYDKNGTLVYKLIVSE